LEKIMTQLFAKFLVLFDPIVDWADRGDTDARKYFSFSVLYLVLTVISGAVASFFRFPEMNWGTGLSGLAFLIFGIMSFGSMLWACLEFFSSNRWYSIWDATGGAISNKVDKAKNEVRNQKRASQDKEITHSVALYDPSASRREDIEYMR
jgi:hypothetical protein